MRDPATFEQRLTDALDVYALSAPVEIDSHALAAGLAARAPRRRFLGVEWPSRSLRLILLAGLLALAAVAGLIAAGMQRLDPRIVQTPGRLLVWMPTEVNTGTAYMYNSAGDLQWTRQIASRGCPRLLADGLLAMGGFGTILIESELGENVAELDVNYTGGERWAPDGRAVALVDIEQGPITVVKFGVGSTEYELAGAVEAVVSNGGERVVVAVRSAVGVDLHLLDGNDTVVHEHRSPVGDLLQMAMAPDGSRVAIVYAGAAGEPLVSVVSLPDGVAVTTGPIVEPGEEFYPISWSPDGSIFALRHGNGVQLYQVAQNAWRDTAMDFVEFVETSRWRVTLGAGPGLAMLSGRFVATYRMDDDPIYMRLASEWTAFSPDGLRVVALDNLPAAQPGGSRDVQIRSSDVWGGDNFDILATLPDDHPPISTDPQLRPCLAWMP